MIFVTSEIRIPLSELELTYARSSGPGGQNVNKVNSKAVLRWNAVESPSLTGEARFRILGKLAARLTENGEIVLASDRFRDQTRNREDCIEKLRELLLAASHRPKARKKSKPSYSSRVKARKKKSLHSQKKKMRGRPGRDE